MNIILLSGGSGKRLWPLSNDVRSKQFIKIFRKNEAGADGELYESMVQRVYRQIRAVDPKTNVTVATSKSQVSAIRNQLGEQVGISVEPCRRDTFPAIVLATAYLHERQGVGLDEPVVVCPVDPYVDDIYFASLRELGALAARGEAHLYLMGVEPTYPSEKYGYIIPESRSEVSVVSTFREKPDAATAAEYIQAGALWNGGVFAYRLGYVLKRAHELLDFAGYDDLLAHYADLPKISFDYAVVEQESQIQVMRFHGMWKDLGTWNTLTEAMEGQALGKVFLNEKCENTHVINEMDVPVLCMGLNNVVVVASAEGVLVSDKGESSFIKPIVDKIDQQVMFAEKSWGSFKVLDVADNSLTIKVTLAAGHQMNYHSHERRDEVWNIVSGQGVVIVDGERRQVSAGEIVELPAGCRHTLMAESELVAIEVQMGQDIDVRDKRKYRLYSDKSFGAYDIRGVYPAEVNEEMAYRIGRVYSQVAKAENVAVGHDIRLSGPVLQMALIRGLTESGSNVLDIGQCGTEMIYATVADRSLDGGIMITASHNPQEYNGFKFVRRGAQPLTGDELQRLEHLMSEYQGPSYEQIRDVEPLGNSMGSVGHENVTAAYIDKILGYVDVDTLRPFRVVVNPGNGAAGMVIREMAKRLPLDIVMVNGEPDGHFPNGVPNPLLPENRECTAAAVRKYGADLGVAWDGDFDRCFLFDERGTFIEGYYLVGFLAQAFLAKEPGACIVYDTRCIWNTEELVREAGGVPVMSKGGHAFIKARMREVDAVYGGEMSAHHYFRDFSYCDSGMLPWLMVLGLLSRSDGKSFSELLGERMEKFPISGEINCQVQDPESVLRRVEARYGEKGKVDKLDGLSIEYPKWRLNLRRSNTEPLIRLNVETRNDKQLCAQMTKEILEIMRI